MKNDDKWQSTDINMEYTQKDIRINNYLALDLALIDIWLVFVCI